MSSESHAFADEGPDRVYAQFIENDQFRIQLCGDCERHVFYPRLVCPHCGANKLEWVAPSGDGTVYSTSIPRGGSEGDYNIALIDLAEGPRMMSRVVDVAPEAVAIGMKVKAFVGDIEGNKVVLFRPTGGEA